MLKKWLKRRRKRPSKQAEASTPPGTATAADEQKISTPKTPTRRGKQGAGSLRKLASRKIVHNSKYTNIEKEGSNQSLSEPSGQSLGVVVTVQDLTVEPAEQTAITPDLNSHEHKREAPIVRITPIERPKPHTAPRESLALLEQAGNRAPVTTSALISPQESAPTPTQTPTLIHPQAFSSSQGKKLSEHRLPSPPPTDHFTRELSYLGVASPPSIDTALFAHEQLGNSNRKDVPDPHEENSEDNTMGPPVLIEARLRKSEILQEIGTSRPFQDGDFFTATRSHSGTGSKKLQSWLDEVLRSIEANKVSTVPVYDRYHVSGDKSTEEKPETDQPETLIAEESLRESKILIDQALKATIEKSKASSLTETPKGILKSKAAKQTKHHNFVEDESGSEVSVSEDDEEGNIGDAAGKLSDDSSVDFIAAKVVSSSKPQKDADDTEEETTSVESRSSSSRENGYETLHQLHPTVSRDETVNSNNSRNFFHGKMCGVGNIMSIEDELCPADDISLSEETFASRSTIATKDSSANRGAGWMCFDAFG